MIRPRQVPSGLRLISRVFVVVFLVSLSLQSLAVGPASATTTALLAAAPAAAGSSFIGGRVFLDENENEVRNSGEDGQDDVTIRLRRNDGSGDTKKTETNGDGYYEFTGLDAGTYLVEIEVPDDYVTTTSTIVEVTVDGTNGTKVANFGIIEEDNGNGNGSNDNDSSGGTTVAIVPPPIPTPVPTNTPAPTSTPLPTATPSTGQLLSGLSTAHGARFEIQGHSDDNGLIADFAGEGDLLAPADLSMRLVLNGEEFELIVVGGKAYRKKVEAPYWNPTDLAGLRASHGLLVAADVLNLVKTPGVVRAVRPLDWSILGIHAVRRYQIELGPPTAPRNSAGARTTDLQVLSGNLEVWASAGDNLIRQAYLQLVVPSSRQDLLGRVQPATLDAWVYYRDLNESFTINEPLSALQPTPAPVVARVAAPAPVRQAPAPAPARSIPTPPPAPTSEPTVVAGEPNTPSQFSQERTAAAERALRALSSSIGPQAGSWADPNRVTLAVPWRSQLMDATGEQPSTDGPASLGMILEAYGVNVTTAELEALAEQWQGTWSVEEPLQLATLNRIGSRGGLRPLGPNYGTGGDQWSAAVARDYIRRGYPILALLRPSFLPGGSTDTPLPDRYVVLVGFEGDDLFYHDPTAPDGASRRVPPTELDLAWSNTTLPRQGVAFGFGANVSGLLELVARPAPTATAEPLAVVTPEVIAAPAVLPTAEPTRPVEQTTGGVHPALIGFFTILGATLGFVLNRVLR